MRDAFRAVAIALALAGCTVGPDYHPPMVASPLQWGREPGHVAGRTDTNPIDAQWWESFRDPELSSLVERLAAQDIDLMTAAERVRQAEDEREVVRAEGLPQLDEKSSYMHQRQSPNGFVSLVQPAPFAPLTYDLWQNALSASWELDLFGRVRRAVEAQRANIAAMIAARHAVALDALANLAQDYMQYRGTQARIAITRRNLVLARRDLALVLNQFDNGVGTTLNVARARAQVATEAANLPTLRAEAARLVNAIGLLLAEPPRALQAELAPAKALPMAPPLVPIGLPADLIRRRPDIAEAEARLHRATAQTGVAVASFYPDVSLTGQFGAQGRIIGNAFSLPDRVFAIGPSVDLPLFKGGRLIGTLHLRRSQQREAALDFRRTVLRAWRDVDDALTAYAEAQQRRVEIAAAERQDRIALGAARQSFALGAIDFLNVISAESALLADQGALARSDTETETDLVGLYKALGGGWQVVGTTHTGSPPG
ncbi:efflux transporter outer membrane subunit [Lichenicoccus sp.]|uniref:efflux transporter outer membrane subunit n=1 Tax=Lichenicoccus sp. TaxID=2781899 RepID=UPI003D0C427C